MKIGILGQGFVDWGGGLDFLRMVSASLHCADPAIEQHVLVPTRGPMIALRAARDRARTLLGKPSNQSARPSREHIERAFVESGAQLHSIDLGPRAIASAARRLGLDVLLPSITPLPARMAQPWIGYLFDFQHKHLPQFFSPEERAKRDAAFERMLREAGTIVVNAQDVAKDVARYYPQANARLFALPFAPAPGNDWFDQSPADVQARHGLKVPYFIICNQFWKHKDHETAFDAFARVARDHPDVALVCTGSTSDYRYPEYFGQLMARAEQNGIAHRIHVLGMIPKLDQVALIRGAIALVQPTLFEGGPGGGAVYDSVSLGVPSIVSDIPVNCEISEPTVSYFSASDPAMLADKMARALTSGQPAPALAANLIAQGLERRARCGEFLLQAIAHAREAKNAALPAVPRPRP